MLKSGLYSFSRALCSIVLKCVPRVHTNWAPGREMTGGLKRVRGNKQNIIKSYLVLVRQWRKGNLPTFLARMWTAKVFWENTLVTLINKMCIYPLPRQCHFWEFILQMYKHKSEKLFVQDIYWGIFSSKKTASNSNVHQCINQRLNKLWYIHIMKIYVAIKRTALGLYLLI